MKNPYSVVFMKDGQKPRQTIVLASRIVEVAAFANRERGVGERVVIQEGTEPVYECHGEWDGHWFNRDEPMQITDPGPIGGIGTPASNLVAASGEPQST